jgi:hypothetical protein
MAYADITLFKVYRGMSTSTSTEASVDNTVIQHCLNAAQAQIDRYTHRTFEAASTAARYFDAIEDVDGRTLYLDDDLAAIDSVTNGDGAALTSTSYVTRPVNATPYREIRIRSGSDNAWTYNTEPENAITVVGYWAYSTAAPDDIAHATVRLANYMYAQKDAGTFDVTVYPEAGAITIPQGIPRDVQELLAPYRKIR